IYQNTVTNSLGKKTIYSYQIDGTQFRLLESLGAGCSSCGSVNKRYRFSPLGSVSYIADLNHNGTVIRAIELQYNARNEVSSKTVSGVGIQPQTTYYEYESHILDAQNTLKLENPLLTQLNQTDLRRIK